MKINDPSKAFLGHIYVEYTGNNVILLNSNKSKAFRNVNLYNYVTDKKGGLIKKCFKIEAFGSKYIVCFDDMSIFKLNSKTNNYEIDEWSSLMEYETFANKDLFMISGKLLLYKEINDTDGRNETFSFNLILDNKEEIIKLVK